jgi:hypothetical protein
MPGVAENESFCFDPLTGNSHTIPALSAQLLKGLIPKYFA